MKRFLLQGSGIEPSPLAWQARILPLNPTHIPEDVSPATPSLQELGLCRQLTWADSGNILRPAGFPRSRERMCKQKGHSQSPDCCRAGGRVGMDQERQRGRERERDVEKHRAAPRGVGSLPAGAPGVRTD